VCTSPLSHIYLGTHVFSPQVFELGRCMLGMGVAARVHVTFESYISWDTCVVIIIILTMV
jgi:hypothetical protein